MTRYYKVLTTIEGLDSAGDKVEVIISVVVGIQKRQQIKLICQHRNIRYVASEKITVREMIDFKGLIFV